MKDQSKTKSQLISEIQRFRQRISYLEKVTSKNNHHEVKLQESEERFRNMFETNHAIMLLINPDTGKIEDANLAACKYYGYSRHIFVNKIYIQNINTLSNKQIKNEMNNALKEKRNYFVFKHKLANDIIRDVEVYSNKTIIKGKELLYSIIHDITERKKAEEALKENEKKYRLLAESVSDIIWTMDMDLRFTYISPSVLQLRGFTVEEAMNQSLDKSSLAI